MSFVLRDVGETMLNEIIDETPTNEDTVHYKGSLELKDIMGEMGVAIVADAKEVPVESLEAGITVLSIVNAGAQPSTMFGRFLVLNSPYTIGFLEEVPSDVRVIFERVTVHEVQKTLTKCMKLAGKVKSLMKTERNLKQVKEAMPNIGFIALRTEFGLPGYPGKAHWRPSLEHVRMSMKKIMDRNLKKAFDLNDKPRPSFPLDTVPLKELKETEAFQEKIT